MTQCDPSFQQKNLFQQGYQSYTPKELKQIEWGLRFTPTVCVLIALYGLVTQNPYILFFVAALGTWAFFAPAAHLMDLIYNHLVRNIFKAVKLPPNPLPRRIACLSTAIMNTIAGIFFLAGFPIAAYITGAMLLSLQAIVIFTHFCAASWMYEVAMRALGKWAKPIDENIARQLLVDDALLIDVRGRDEFDSGHIDNAINIPLDELEKRIDQLKTCTVLIYCRSGARSQIATQRLKEFGLTQVYDLGEYNRAQSIVASVQNETSTSTTLNKEATIPA